LCRPATEEVGECAAPHVLLRQLHCR
jgi:hypothetical protein